LARVVDTRGAGAAPVEFRVLGPVRAFVDSVPVDLGPPKRRLLLAVLALECGRPVPLDRLIDLTWEEPPSAARAVVFAHVSRLRKALAGAARHGVEVVSTPPGYTLRADPSAVDAQRFRRLVGDASAVADPAARGRLLGNALQLWRGQPMEDLSLGPAARRLCVGLDELRLTAIEDRMGARLTAGAHQEVLPELADLVERHPTREGLAGHYMMALYRAGNTSRALEVYGQLRADLADRLGLDPGPAVAALHLSILRRDPDLVPRPAVANGANGAIVVTADDEAALDDEPMPDRPVPAQLPPAVAAFTGRDAALAELDAALGGGVGVAGVWGSAGIGKTALAVHWARRMASAFPDGQLHADLRGFGPGEPSMPAEVLRGFLDALGIAPHRIPTDLTARTGLYRSLLAGRRVLVVLDNAASAEQVRPLLPAGSGSFAVVTSRHQLTSLVAVDGARPVALELPTADEAWQMLAGRVGAERLRESPRAARDIIAACARLPLALSVAAARATVDSGLDALARDLYAERTRLDVLDGGEPSTSLRAVFSWSYRRLRPAAARVFRLLAVHPGPVLSVPGAASLTGWPADQVRAHLGELAAAHLAERAGPDAFSCHDLLRAYATELGAAPDTRGERPPAVRRLLDYHLHSAFAADRLLNPSREPIALPPVGAGVTTAGFATTADALAWFAAELPALLPAVRTAGETAGDRYTWQLAWTLADVLEWQGRWHDLATVARLALAALRRLGTVEEQARMLRISAIAYVRLGRHADAATQLEQALDVCERLDDPTGAAHTHHSLAVLRAEQGQHEAAIGHEQRALAWYRAIGHHSGQSRALNAIGWCTAMLGRYRDAIGLCEEALAAAQRADDQYSEAATWDSLGFAHRHLDELDRAAECCDRSLAIYRRARDHYNEALVLVHLGDVRAGAGEPDMAREAWVHAVGILDRLDPVAAAEVRAKLAQGPARSTRRVS
jgi:DNA-binding SARP family transcriptional activator/tetratricopeptide (TPR) repeat protein